MPIGLRDIRKAIYEVAKARPEISQQKEALEIAREMGKHILQAVRAKEPEQEKIAEKGRGLELGD